MASPMKAMPLQHDVRADDRADDADASRDGRRAPGRRSRSDRAASRQRVHQPRARRPLVEVALARRAPRRGGGRRRARRSGRRGRAGGRRRSGARTSGSRTSDDGPCAMTVRLIASDLLEALGGAGQVVGRRDDRLAAPRLGLEDVHEVFLGRGVDAGHRLVEQEQVRLAPPAPGPGRPAAAGRPTGARSASAVVGHADLLEGFGDGAPVVAGPGRRTGPRRG